MLSPKGMRLMKVSGKLVAVVLIAAAVVVAFAVVNNVWLSWG